MADGDPFSSGHVAWPNAAGSRIRLHDGSVRRAFATCDVLTASTAWLFALVLGGPGAVRPASITALGGWAVAAGVLTALMLAREQLYLTRVWAVRAVEVQRVGRGGLAAGLVLLTVHAIVGGPLTPSTAALAVVLTGALVVTARTSLLARLHATPAADACQRALVITDDVDEGDRVLRLLASRPGLGYRPVGLVCQQRPPAGNDVPWVGTPADLPVLTRLTAVTSVVVAGDSFDDDGFAHVLDHLQPLDVHTHAATRRPGDAPRLRVLPLVHRAAAIPSDPTLSTVQRVTKRGFDLLAGGLLAIAALPIVAIAGMAIRLATGGPALAREVFIGPAGEPVVVRRLRTTQLPDTLWAARIGRLCQRLHIDDLPQLGNVLEGTMTLVGPRPRRRRRRGGPPLDMRAGMIGLRHVETPAYPELGRHRRTDEFYIENWSIGLDLSILATSASDVLWRGVRRLVRAHDVDPATA